MIKHIVIVNATWTTMQKTPFAVAKWAEEYGDNWDRVNIIWSSRNNCTVYSNEDNKMCINIHDTVLSKKVSKFLAEKVAKLFKKKLEGNHG